MSYFRELPNLEYVSRFPNAGSNDEVTVSKNIFKRPKLREDLNSIFSAFDYYAIVDGERPDQIAEKVYGDSQYDWVILIANNIINVNDDWPLSSAQLNEYLLKKYPTEEELQTVKYYETIELKDSTGRIVLPGGLIVDKAFYDAPEYESLDELPPGITFPPIFLNGIVAVTSSILGDTTETQYSVQSVVVQNEGRGYKTTPLISFSSPTITELATASVGITNFTVTSIIGLTTGGGYRTTPSVTFSNPPNSVQSSAICTLGTNETEGQVVNIVITNNGIGYGVTSPIVTFSLPPEFITGATYKNESQNAVGNQIDGMYIRSDGLRLYTASTFGTPLLRQYNFSTAWDVRTLSSSGSLDVSDKFSYCSGIELSPDGTKLYVVGGQSGTFLVAQYTLLSPWTISSASFVSQFLLTAPGGVRLKPDGSRLYILNSNSPDSIEEYQLITPWNVSSSIFTTSHNIETSVGDNGILGFSFNSDGTKMFATGVTNSSVYEFDLESWNLNTLNFVTLLYVGDRIPNPSDAFISPNVDKLLVVGGSGDRLFEYNINVRASATATVSNSRVSQINLTNSGIGYTLPPTITISSPYPSVTAQGSATLSSGHVSSITITNPGFGYTQPPSITIGNPPEYRTASGIASVRDGKIISINLLDGGLNYDQPPTITFSVLPEPVLNVEVDETYSQNNKTWKWNGTEWQEKVTEEFKFLDNELIISTFGSAISKSISNYEHEVRINEQKRLIIIPRSEYLTTIVKDLKDMMKYDKNAPGVINSKLKKTYNPKLSGV